MTVARSVARVYLDGDYTFRWRRGDRLAFVFLGREAGDSDHTAGAVDSVPVLESGWTDVADVRRVAKRWLLQHGKVGLMPSGVRIVPVAHANERSRW